MLSQSGNRYVKVIDAQSGVALTGINISGDITGVSTAGDKGTVTFKTADGRTRTNIYRLPSGVLYTTLG
jgi:hypothetical protein